MVFNLKQHLCRVIDNRTLVPDTQLLTFHASELARTIRPGQFALARDPLALDPYLRRTLWFYSIDAETVAFTLSANDVFAIRTRIGDTIDLLAPLGRVIDFETHMRRILLIGETSNIAPLIAIAHDAIARAHEVVLATYSATQNITPLLAPEIEYRTDDGLNPELIAWADAIVAIGSMEFYRTIANAVRAARYQLELGFARGLIDVPMPCGTGACYACAVDTTRGVKLACTDGAWFDLIDFENRRRG